MSVPDRTTSRRSHVSTVVRAAVSLGLLTWLAWGLDWSAFARTLADIDAPYLALSLGITPVLVLLSAWKWQILLRARGIDASLWQLTRLYLLGYFFGQFLPTSVGGDVARVFALARATGRTADVTASVFLERLTGVVVLMALAIGVLFLAPAGLWSSALRVGAGLLTVGLVAGIWIIVDSRFIRQLERLADRWRFLAKLLRFHEAVHAYKGERRTIDLALLLSLAYYLAAAVNVYWSLLAFRSDATLVHAMLVTPVVLMVTMLPISIGGIGLAEWAYVYALGQFGVSEAQALSCALLLRAKVIVLAVIGGVEAARSPWRPAKSELQSTPLAAGEKPTVQE